MRAAWPSFSPRPLPRRCYALPQILLRLPWGFVESWIWTLMVRASGAAGHPVSSFDKFWRPGALAFLWAARAGRQSKPLAHASP